MDIAAVKRQLRQDVIARRQLLTAEEHASRSLDACKKLANLIHEHSEGKDLIVALYSPIKSEPDILPLATWAQNNGLRTAYPVIIDGEMRFCISEGSDEFVKHPTRSYTLEEIKSQGTDILDPKDIDVVVVPLVAFDCQGYRLGYGGGYYDRFLAGLSHRPLVVGVAFKEQCVSSLPHEPHDVALPHIVVI